MTNTETVSTERLEHLRDRVNEAKSNGDPEKYMAFITVRQAHEIGTALTELLASRTQESAEWPKKAIATAIFDPGAFVGMKGERTLTEWQVDAVMTALRAASITPPAPERSKEEASMDRHAYRVAHLPYPDALEPASLYKGEAVAWFNEHNFRQEMENEHCATVYQDRTDLENSPLYASPAPLPVGEEEALLALIREEAGKDNSPLGRSDSLAIRRIRTALGLDPHSGAALSKPGEQ